MAFNTGLHISLVSGGILFPPKSLFYRTPQKQLFVQPLILHQQREQPILLSTLKIGLQFVKLTPRYVDWPMEEICENVKFTKLWQAVSACQLWYFFSEGKSFHLFQITKKKKKKETPGQHNWYIFRYSTESKIKRMPRLFMSFKQTIEYSSVHYYKCYFIIIVQMYYYYYHYY